MFGQLIGYAIDMLLTGVSAQACQRCHFCPFLFPERLDAIEFEVQVVEDAQ